MNSGVNREGEKGRKLVVTELLNSTISGMELDENKTNPEIEIHAKLNVLEQLFYWILREITYYKYISSRILSRV